MKRCSMAKTLRVKVLIVSFPSSAQAASKRYRLRPSEAGDVLAGRDPAGLLQADIKPSQSYQKLDCDSSLVHRQK
ncbi:hypothetical protein RRG08_003051 [Elysia crispata]|uniref:Uncharacterized protein n=1 Tax=Elysia crispata TaxID=231223 RepID=A0AAE1B741_9GAST|nr:hypothetical protein RRG08_003051 [Elysia crispata]